MEDIRYPESALLKEMYANLYTNLISSSRQKKLDSNKMKSNLADPHSKAICVPGVPGVQVCIHWSVCFKICQDRVRNGWCRLKKIISNF